MVGSLIFVGVVCGFVGFVAGMIMFARCDCEGAGQELVEVRKGRNLLRSLLSASQEIVNRERERKRLAAAILNGEAPTACELERAREMGFIS